MSIDVQPFCMLHDVHNFYFFSHQLMCNFLFSMCMHVKWHTMYKNLLKNKHYCGPLWEKLHGWLWPCGPPWFIIIIRPWQFQCSRRRLEMPSMIAPFSTGHIAPMFPCLRWHCITLICGLVIQIFWSLLEFIFAQKFHSCQENTQTWYNILYVEIEWCISFNHSTMILINALRLCERVN